MSLLAGTGALGVFLWALWRNRHWPVWWTDRDLSEMSHEWRLRHGR